MEKLLIYNFVRFKNWLKNETQGVGSFTGDICPRPEDSTNEKMPVRSKYVASDLGNSGPKSSLNPEKIFGFDSIDKKRMKKGSNLEPKRAVLDRISGSSGF